MADITLLERRYFRLTSACVVGMGCIIHLASASPSTDPLLETFLAEHCTDCHGGEKPKGDLSLEDTAALDSDTWGLILDQIATDEMPPKKRKSRPAVAEREKIIAALTTSLTDAGRPPTSAGGPLPQDGNLVDHERLFSGVHTGPGSSPPRFWRRSQPQYDALMEQLWVIPKLRYEKAHQRSDPEWAAFSYSQPFPALDPENFTNYSGDIHADEATLRALLSAGGQIAERLTAENPAFSNTLQPPIAVGIPSIKRGSEWEKFKVEPPPRPEEFEPFLTAKKSPTNEEQRAALARVFAIILNRAPSTDEKERYGGLLKRSLAKSGPPSALRGLITAIIVSPEFVFRMEVGLGKSDQHGRRMLSANELVYAIGHALADSGPDAVLREAASSGKLETVADVEREVRRILDENEIEKNRILRFFQEFFGYPNAIEIFKDEGGWKNEVQYLIRDADMLVENALANDQNVFEELLTTDRYFVAYPHIEDPKLFDAIIEFTKEQTKEGIEKTKARGKKIEPDKTGRYSRAWAYLQNRELIPRTVHNDRGSFEMSYISVYGIDGNTFEWTPDQPIQVPGRRAGILTHPAWLVAHSTSFDNDIVGRGHWIREHLLAGKIPDVPIDVEAQVPDEPDNTLRHRMRVTQEERCIRCHRRMDPLGFPFEIYDHYGHFREKEMVGTRDNQLMDIDASGEILESGEEGLEGSVEDAIDLVQRLSKSTRVRQSIIRHAFRYWMGRNETLADSPTLIEADRAYVRSGGSFREVIVSLLTSDPFLFRK